jgi:DNA-binding beta-propeller fold protein YncE
MRLLRTIGLSLCAPVAALTLLIAAPAAHADTAFVKAWGSGVSTGARQLESCTTTCQIGLAWGDAGALAYPADAAVSPTGNILVGAFDANRIDVFSPDGSFIRGFGWSVAGGAGLQICTTSCVLGSAGGGAGQLAQPWGVAADASGNVVVSEFNNHRVSVFTEAGAFVRTFGWGVRTGPTRSRSARPTASPGSPDRVPGS